MVVNFRFRLGSCPVYVSDYGFYDMPTDLKNRDLNIYDIVLQHGKREPPHAPPISRLCDSIFIDAASGALISLKPCLISHLILMTVMEKYCPIFLINNCKYYSFTAVKHSAHHPTPFQSHVSVCSSFGYKQRTVTSPQAAAGGSTGG